jgi:hypothetical protein
MKNLFITTILVFFINFANQVVLDIFLSEKKGEIISSVPLRVDSVTTTQILTLANYEKKTLENFEFYSTSGKISNIYSNNPITFKKSAENRFSIDKLYPLSNSTIKVDVIEPASNSKVLSEILPLNYSENNWTFQKLNDLAPRKKIDWLSISINSLIYAIIFYCFYYYLESRNTKRSQGLTNEINTLKDDAENIKNNARRFENIQEENIKDAKLNLEKTKIQLNDFKVSYAKLKILLLRKTKDLQKENEFYKSLFSSIITKNNIAIDKNDLEESVRVQLKTYSTKGMFNPEVDTIDIIASIINEKGKEQSNNSNNS